MRKLAFLLIIASIFSACNKLDQDVETSDELALANRSEIEELNRSVHAERENTQQTEFGLEGDVRSLQDWQESIKNSAAKSQAFNDAIENQFKPLYECLNEDDNAECQVLEKIKSCLRDYSRDAESRFCRSINELFKITDSHNERLLKTESCLGNTEPFSFSQSAPFDITVKEDFQNCSSLIYIASFAQSLARSLHQSLLDTEKRLNDRISDLNTRVTDLEAKLERLSNLTILLDRLSLLEDQRMNESMAISKLAKEVKSVLFAPNVQDKVDSIKDINNNTEHCYFTGNSVNTAPECTGQVP
ncbi:hypothetical protein [Pseudobacteriovorax antillogorgiicola]|uniref:Uncharacterized protein n=1 Tax=Pseudobacteriovorax antillogorgiicola TaxID=1513793 RepID=A0A1Y6BG87_9BACT|nr:hypothetical protein [Pseudobacteriovorax antillogorgiicola]TCS57534.1 hypothetical protein EDD56_103274 [Pseudobacteriovorax antillogorgiicola]SME99990.1 hypothetical protein SAMN06296036_10359 [Pseudobacteriovorax antillogorgiicola]